MATPKSHYNPAPNAARPRIKPGQRSEKDGRAATALPTIFRRNPTMTRRAAAFRACSSRKPNAQPRLPTSYTWVFDDQGTQCFARTPSRQTPRTTPRPRAPRPARARFEPGSPAASSTPSSRYGRRQGRRVDQPDATRPHALPSTHEWCLRVAGHCELSLQEVEFGRGRTWPLAPTYRPDGPVQGLRAIDNSHDRRFARFLPHRLNWRHVRSSRK